VLSAAPASEALLPHEANIIAATAVVKKNIYFFIVFANLHLFEQISKVYL
jgi:hypothetical protein